LRLFLTVDLVARFLKRRLEHADRVVREIHSRDDMLRYAMIQSSGDVAGAHLDYMANGLVVLQSMRQLVRWRFGGWDGVGAVLDFAAGFGRVTRMISHDVPDERLWAAEIDPAALEFLSDTIGVRTIASAAHPSEMDCRNQFDLILVSSLFSHLPEALFIAWLERLAGLLQPGGMLAFSVHDKALLPIGAVMPKSGIIFQPTSESRVLDAEIYGSTWVTEDFVRRVASDVAPSRPCLRVPRGHCGYQDLYLLLETPGVEAPSPPQIDPGPEGFIDHYEVDQESDCVVFGGWSVDRVTRRAPSSIVVELSGEEYQTIQEFENRPDVRHSKTPVRPEKCGLGVRIPLPLLLQRHPATVTVEAVSAGGVRSLLFAGELPALHLRVVRTHYGF
jgi:SAM-dependent methyltransferase